VNAVSNNLVSFNGVFKGFRGRNLCFGFSNNSNNSHISNNLTSRFSVGGNPRKKKGDLRAVRGDSAVCFASFCSFPATVTWLDIK